MNRKIPLFAICYLLFAGTLFFVPSFSLAQSTVQQFFVGSNFDSAGREEVTSTLRHTSLRSYIYVEDDFFATLATTQKNDLPSRLADLAREFDNTIYPQLRGAYGSEWTPGVDNDVRLTILLTQLKSGIGGYIDTVDETPRSINERSNEREMMYINASGIFSFDARAWVAHEFVHLITYNQKDRIGEITEKEWLAEALAEYAPTLLGYNDEFSGSYLEARVQNFLNLPSDALLEWQGTAFDASSANLFIHYVVGLYGTDILGSIMASSRIGPSAIDEALASMGFVDTFSDVFTRWTLANYINGTTIQSSTLYAYQTPALQFENFHVTPLITSSIFSETPNSLTLAVKSWEGRWYRFLPGELGRVSQNVLKIEFFTSATGELSRFQVPYVVTNIAGARSVHMIQVAGGRGVAYIPSFGTEALSVVVSPANHLFDLTGDFYPFVPFTLSVSLVDNAPALYPDGSLLRARGDSMVYVIEGETKRWIQSPEIFNGYGHLRWQDIIEVAPTVLDTYSESFLIRLARDPRVYEVTSLGEKRWLNITARQFETSGRSWNAIYTVNKNEFLWYQEGAALSF